MVRNSKILVAGGSGFIGSNLISDLVSLENEVISISKNNIKMARKIKGAKYIYHDLCKPINKDQFTSLKDIDYIINCSGYINHNNFQNGGKEIFNQHLESVYLLTNLAIDLNVKTFVQIGSSDEYGKKQSPINESIREEPMSPYSLAKLASTHLLEQYNAKGILNSVILRPFLVFGENQSKDRFLPFLIDNCIKDREFKVTYGEQIRDYLYIKDFNRALINTLDNEKAYGQVFNIASGIPISIKELIIYVNQIIGMGHPIFGGIDYREGESMNLYADINKAKKLLFWKPKFELKKSLKKVISWYRNNA